MLWFVHITSSPCLMITFGMSRREPVQDKLLRSLPLLGQLPRDGRLSISKALGCWAASII